MASLAARITLGTLMLAGAVAGAAGAPQPAAAAAALSHAMRSPTFLALGAGIPFVGVMLAGTASVVRQRAPVARATGRHRAAPRA